MSIILLILDKWGALPNVFRFCIFLNMPYFFSEMKFKG